MRKNIQDSYQCCRTTVCSCIAPLDVFVVTCTVIIHVSLIDGSIPVDNFAKGEQVEFNRSPKPTIANVSQMVSMPGS
jgi:hypothetical protein